MGKISQGTAEKVALEITKPLKEGIAKKEKELGEALAQVLEKEVPKEVAEAYKKYPTWIKSRSGVSLQGHGFSYTGISLYRSVPREKEEYYYNIPAAESKAIHKLNNELIDLEKQYKETRETIENTLLTLGTDKRVQETYPEAYPFLPVRNNCTALIVDIKGVREMTCTLIPGCITAVPEKKVAKKLSKKPTSVRK